MKKLQAVERRIARLERNLARYEASAWSGAAGKARLVRRQLREAQLEKMNLQWDLHYLGKAG